jgi:hypothetical protein
MVHEVDTAEEAVRLVEEQFRPRYVWGFPNIYIGLHVCEKTERLTEENLIRFPWKEWPEDTTVIQKFFEEHL